MSKYSIERIDVNNIEDVWSNSPQKTIFTHPKVLAALAYKVDWWGVYKGKELRCIWPVVLDEEEKPIQAPLTYWQGPLWTQKAFNRPAHRSLSSTTSVYECFINKFLAVYGAINSSLHPSLTDVRVFNWWNYHELDKPKFQIHPRYSAWINLLNNGLDKYFRIVRRQELRKFDKIENQFYDDDSCSLDELLMLYLNTIDSKETGNEKVFTALLKLVDDGFGWIQAIRHKQDNKVKALSIILNDTNQANLLISLAENEFKDQGILAANTYKAISTSKEIGLSCFDFNGANSPYRGDDKHSYGAKPILYFDIEYVETPDI